MNRKKLILVSMSLLCLQFVQAKEHYDVCIYGATSAGVIAAYTAKMMGRSVVLIEPSNHIGGLSSGGLGMTDIGNKYVVNGLALDFYRRIGKHYGRFEAWIFEPHVAKEVFMQYLDEAKIKTLLQHKLVNVHKQEAEIQSIEVQHGNTTTTIQANIFIDCSYEGDLMAKAGVSYTIGREPNKQYNEKWNGVQLLTKHQFPDGVDPYRKPGDPSSGLLWGISSESLAERGTGDKKVQAYNFRICLTNNPANRITITRPPEYDSSKYGLLIRLLEKKPAPNLNAIIKMDRMPKSKTDINNNGGFSTDMIGMNYDYPDGDDATRNRIIKEHEQYIKGLLYFIGHDNRIPAGLQREMLQWGYPKDEYTNNGNWSPQLYIREARRLIGEYIMTQANCEGKALVDDGIGMAAYTMDSHNCQRIVVNGMVKNEGDVQVGGFGPYPVSYRSILPKEKECINLLVPVCLSASHIAYGSIRMEPVFMVLAQAAATAAVMALDKKTSLHKVDIAALRQVIKDNPWVNGKTADIIIDNADKAHVTVSGGWHVGKYDGYGPDFLVSDSAIAGTIQFKPDIPLAGNYAVYVYVMPKRKNGVEQTEWTVVSSREEKKIAIRKDDIKVEGQTNGEWYLLGNFYLDKGDRNAVTVQATAAKEEVIADAVLFQKIN